MMLSGVERSRCEVAVDTVLAGGPQMIPTSSLCLQLTAPVLARESDT